MRRELFELAVNPVTKNWSLPCNSIKGSASTGMRLHMRKQPASVLHCISGIEVDCMHVRCCSELCREWFQGREVGIIPLMASL